MPDTNDIDIDALQAQLMKAREDEGWFITGDQAKDFSRALTALVAERDALQAKINAHAEDRRKYIDAWEGWIASTKRLRIAEWLRVYADAVPIPSLNGDEAKERVFKHLDQRMRDAAETIDELRKRVAELESQEFTLPHDPFRNADRDLRDRLVCAALTGVCADPNMNDPDIARFAGDIADAAVAIADATLAAMRKGDANA